MASVRRAALLVLGLTCFALYAAYHTAGVLNQQRIKDGGVHGARSASSEKAARGGTGVTPAPTQDQNRRAKHGASDNRLAQSDWEETLLGKRTEYQDLNPQGTTGLACADRILGRLYRTDNGTAVTRNRYLRRSLWYANASSFYDAYIDHVYVVHYSKSKERWASANEKLRTLRMSADFFVGFEDQEVEAVRSCFLSPDAKVAFHYSFRNLSKAEMSIVAKVIGILHDVVAQGYESVLIVEDDVNFLDNTFETFSVALQTLLDQSPPVWDMLFPGESCNLRGFADFGLGDQLGSDTGRYPTYPSFGKAFYLVQRSRGLGAWFVSQRAARHLLKSLPVSKPADHWINEAVRISANPNEPIRVAVEPRGPTFPWRVLAEHQLLAFWTEPPMFGQSALKSLANHQSNC